MFSGLSAFPITPTDEGGIVDADALGMLLSRLGADQVQSVGLLGSTGGYAYLTRPERRRAVAIAAEACAVPLMIGVGALRTDDAQALARDAADAGADALLLAPMSYTPLTAEEVFQHYAAVAKATDLPVCVYNNPTTTHFVIDQSLLVRLANIPNVAAVKMPFPADRDVATQLGQLRLALPESFVIGYSGDWGAATALMAGADAWFSVLAGILPDVSAQLTYAARRGDVAGAKELDARLEPMWALLKAFGGVRVSYAIAHLMGLTDAQPPRPILPLAGDDRDRVAQVLATP